MTHSQIPSWEYILDHFMMPTISAMEITSMEQGRSEEFYGNANDGPRSKDSLKVLPALQMFVCFFLLEIIMNGNCNEQEVS